MTKKMGRQGSRNPPALTRSGGVAKIEAALRRAIVASGQTLARDGLTPGRSGNVSARIADGMLISPSGMAYEDTRPGDIVRLAADGTVTAGQRKPSSEWHFHLAIYRARPDVGAVVHTHSLNATALACAGRSIPAFHYMVATAGGSDIPLVPYATFGTPELAELVAAGLTRRNACLLAHHGQIAVGGNLADALHLAAEVETLAAQYVRVLAIGGSAILDDDEMQRVRAKFATYGQTAQCDG
jgi:L-fuculose-phosphate aldolase